MSKHTPGPWHWTNEYQARDLSDTWSLIGGNGYGILSCDGLGNSPPEFHKANARLIAAAPDLLAFAQEFIADYQSEDGMDSIKHYAAKAQAAIAKATGEEK